MTDFFKEPKKLQINDTEILVSPLRVKQIVVASKLIKPAVQIFSDLGINQNTVLTNLDVIVPLLALAINKEESFIEELDAAQLIKITEAVIEVNADFFIKEVAPKVQELLKNVSEATKQVGQMS